MSTRVRLRLLLVPLLALLVVAGVADAAASPTSASGSFTYTSSTFNNTRVIGSDTFIDLDATVTYTGTLQGTSIVRGLLVLHADGTANFWDIETFTGKVNGTPGTLVFYLHGSGSLVPAGIGAFHGTQTIVTGTGDLANLRGVLHQVGTVPKPLPGPLGTYTGKLRFEDEDQLRNPVPE